MPNASLKISSDTLGVDAAHFEITVVQTGADTASLDVREWKAPADVTAAPDTDNSYDLFGIQRQGDSIVCYSKSLWQTPKVTIKPSPIGLTPSITIRVDHMWFGPAPLVLRISDADRTALETFLSAAAFPF